MSHTTSATATLDMTAARQAQQAPTVELSVDLSSDGQSAIVRYHSTHRFRGYRIFRSFADAPDIDEMVFEHHALALTGELRLPLSQREINDAVSAEYRLETTGPIFE